MTEWVPGLGTLPTWMQNRQGLKEQIWNSCPGWVAWLVAGTFCTTKGCRFDPLRDEYKDKIDQCFSHRCFSLSLLLPSFSLSYSLTLSHINVSLSFPLPFFPSLHPSLPFFLSLLKATKSYPSLRIKKGTWNFSQGGDSDASGLPWTIFTVWTCFCIFFSLILWTTLFYRKENRWRGSFTQRQSAPRGDRVFSHWIHLVSLWSTQISLPLWE